VNLAWRWLAASALLLLALPACFGGPADPVEYLHEPTIVLLQLQEVPDGVDTRRSVPRLTLYGDGTVIFVDDAGALMQATLSDDDVQRLLETAVDAGFLDFDYDQLLPDSADPEPVTYLYVQTRDGANAVKARGLGSAEDVAGDEFAEYRAMQDLRDDLVALEPGEAAPFQAQTALVWAERVDDAPEAPEWPYPEVSLTDIARDSADGDDSSITDDVGGELASSIALNALYRQDGQTYRVSFRPPLPHENAFPEFDSLGP
jgi:hypothetical protein